MLAWQFPERGLPNIEAYDRLAVVAISLRTPLDSASGGEVVVACFRDQVQVGGYLTIPLEPGAFEALPAELKTALDVWLVTVFKAKNLVPGGAEQGPRPTTPKPKPDAAPPGFAPTLG